MEYNIETILEMYEDDYNPSSTVPGPRNMYAQGQLVQPPGDGSRPGYAGEKFLVKVGSPKKLENVIEQEFIEVTGSKNRPETYKKTGVKKTLYKPQIIVKNKVVLTTDFGTKADAVNAVKDYRKTNPIKNAPPDLTTLDERKKKKYLDKKERTKKISEQGGVESFETGDDKIHKGHSQNIDNPNVKIKPSNIIYTPQKINQSMAGSEGKSRYTDLDYKIDEAENKIKKIKKSKIPSAAKKKLLLEQDNLLMKYVAQSDGYKTVTLSNNKPYGEIFQKSKSMDMFDEFSNMTEKETKKFVNNYFTDEGKLKDKWTKGNVSDLDKKNIQKSYTFLENIKNAKNNAKQVASLLEKLGCGKSAGGRIMFGNGTSCAIKGREVLEKGLKNGFKKSDVGLAQKILGTGKFLKDAVSLRGLFGPLALGFTVAAEAGIVGYDMLSGGKSFREAVGDSVFNYMLGDKTKINSEEEFIKRLKNVPGSPGQGFRGFTDDDINKMLVFKSKLDDMQTGFSNYSDLLDINEKIKENTERQNIGSGFFPDESFQLEAEKDKIQADIRDYNKVGTPRNVTEYMISDEGVKGGDALARGTLLAKESQLLDAYRSSPKGIENLKKDLIDTRFNLEQIYNPTKLTRFGQAFMDATPGEQSYFMGRTDFMEGGIASLNVNKK